MKTENFYASHLSHECHVTNHWKQEKQEKDRTDWLMARQEQYFRICYIVGTLKNRNTRLLLNSRSWRKMLFLNSCDPHCYF